MRRWLLALLCLAIAACSEEPTAKPNARPAPAIPLTGWVTDAADLLVPAREAALSRSLQEFQVRTSHQLVVATVPSLNGERIEQFSLRLANSWGIGDADRDDGVVLLLAPNERQVRIEVGLGLEPRLTNARCTEILASDVMPRLRAGDVQGGIEAGAAALIAELESR